MKITIQELSKSFGGRDIFNNFSLEVDSGVRLCVCGPNGTGKSTLLRLLAGHCFAGFRLTGCLNSVHRRHQLLNSLDIHG